MAFQPGEVYWAGLGERRMVIVVSREVLNRGEYLTVVPVTSARFEDRARLRNCVPFSEGQLCFDRNCVAQAENLSLIDKVDLDLERGAVGRLDEASLRDLVRAIGYVIQSECEPE